MSFQIVVSTYMIRSLLKGTSATMDWQPLESTFSSNNFYSLTKQFPPLKIHLEIDILEVMGMVRVHTRPKRKGFCYINFINSPRLSIRLRIIANGFNLKGLLWFLGIESLVATLLRLFITEPMELDFKIPFTKKNEVT